MKFRGWTSGGPRTHPGRAPRRRGASRFPCAGLVSRHVVDRSCGRPSTGRLAVAMIRVPVAVEAPPATAMNCEDARCGLSALVDGPIGLTDWALLEAHLKQCAQCRQAEAQLRQLAAASHPVTPPRAVLASLRKATALARIGATCSTALVVRRRALLTAAARELTPRATADVIRTSLAIPLRSSFAAVAHALEAVRRMIRFRPSGQAMVVGLALAFTLYALQGTDGPQ